MAFVIAPQVGHLLAVDHVHTYTLPVQIHRDGKPAHACGFHHRLQLAAGRAGTGLGQQPIQLNRRGVKRYDRGHVLPVFVGHYRPMFSPHGQIDPNRAHRDLLLSGAQSDLLERSCAASIPRPTSVGAVLVQTCRDPRPGARASPNVPNRVGWVEGWQSEIRGSRAPQFRMEATPILPTSVYADGSGAERTSLSIQV